ncbi:hypothetical protein [Planctobacterium marinum]|uniref:hypothetical protein n=1 Tax=Planctobacterium marinum TaxID=1631968 RepID=UPI001E3A755F|nr:hypothetical protein [Planctobacterium marinum]MCC2605822.1 hypothetical protein [Planctobacterium marinum]
MKSLKVILATALVLASTATLASGTKQPDPNKTQRANPILIQDSGTKQPDPTDKNGKGQVIVNDSGTKQPDPLKNDSGYPTLMALLSKYFSI